MAHSEKLFRDYLQEEVIADLLNRIETGTDSNEKDASNTMTDRSKARKDRSGLWNTAEKMIIDILESKEIEDAVTGFFTRVIESDKVQAAIQKVVQKLWYDLVNDPETVQQVVHLLNIAIQNEAIKKSVTKLVLQLINDKEVYEELEQLVVRLGNEPQVRCFARKLFVFLPIKIVVLTCVGPLFLHCRRFAMLHKRYSLKVHTKL